MVLSLPSIAVAVWKMVNQSNRIVRTTQEIVHGSVSFTGTENTHTADISALGAVNIDEIELHFNGPHSAVSASGNKQAVAAYVTDASTLTFEKTNFEGAGACTASGPHYFCVRRIVR